MIIALHPILKILIYSILAVAVVYSLWETYNTFNRD